MKAKRKPVEAGDGTYGGAVLAAFDAMSDAKAKNVTIKVEMTEDQAWALAQLCKRFGLHHATELANAFDGGAERDHMIDAIGRLERALRKQGWDPR